MRCVHIGLLCVQDNAADRPIMPDVVFMLSSETDLPQPKRPIFTFENSVSDPQPKYDDIFSTNEATITMIEGRLPNLPASLAPPSSAAAFQSALHALRMIIKLAECSKTPAYLLLSTLISKTGENANPFNSVWLETGTKDDRD
ncbi:Hypothetical predicted protein [Prunus dulcis]|uniref:S-locus receptor kinase C-terminal domain-containing protein n=1 Tax=Prunus dulcis TaxID=3755 RepID=A0A5E4G4T0_PRUDU|nr:Hypothetical predicted protein [Prunus dulcis]